MPMVEIFTRECLSDTTKGKLAASLTQALILIEVERVTDAAKAISLVVFHTLGNSGILVGGVLDDRYEAGRKFAIARVQAPEAFLNRELKEKAIGEVTDLLKEALGAGSQDDGSGIFVSVVETPADNWGSRGKISRLPSIISRMDGDVSPERQNDQHRYFDGYKHMKEQFDIPA